LAIASLPNEQARNFRLVAAGWFVVLALVVALLVAGRQIFDKAHIALILLLVVLGASASGGRRLGIAVAATAFLSFDFFLLPPYYTFTIANPLDWLVLLAFLVTSVVAASLLHGLQREARAAQRGSEEVAQLASLGAEALNAPRADTAVAAVGEVIRRTLGVERAETQPLATLRAQQPSVEAIAMLSDGVRRLIPSGSSLDSLEWMATTPIKSLVLPLRVRDRIVGTLELTDSRGIRLDRAARRFVDVLAYYAALGAERSRLEAEAKDVDALREADRVKNALLASVSHDLRTPLTSITAFANELATFGDERAELIAQEAGRLNRMVTDLLDLSRLASGSFAPVVEVVAVDDLVAGAVQQVEGALGSERIDVRLGADSPFLTGRFDLTQAIRILVNLIDNAAKHSPTGTKVVVSVERDGDWILLHVADRGPGVAPSEVERIFEPFYRPAGSTPDSHGAGLGLAIARGLAEAQGGSVTYAPRPDGGSVFTLRLPAVEITTS
jgi:two-component system sensor histidine kinase KdpD